MLLHIRIFIVWITCCSGINGLDITDSDIKDAFSEASENIKEQHENRNYENYYFAGRYDGKEGAFAAYLQKYGDYLEYEKFQEVLEETTRILKRKFNLTLDDINDLKNIDLTQILQSETEQCMRVFENLECNVNSPYRTMDGSCNNLDNPFWGKSFTCYNRILDSNYGDDVSTFRQSAKGGDLPTPRNVSVNIDPDRTVPSTVFTIMHMQFGQFLAHDITFAPKPDLTRPLGPIIKCCPEEETDITLCGPIKIPKDDYFYSKYGVECLENSRSHLCVTCRLGSRTQVNQLTAFIDGSGLYGSTKEMSDKLRTLDGTGTLKYLDDSNAGPLLSESLLPDEDKCSFQQQTRNCFQGGDFQLNQHTMLTAIETVFMRQHNNIAQTLHSQNKDYSEEKLFQETRRIFGAQLQVITYNEFLPRLIGKDAMDRYNLSINTDKSYTEYNPAVDPSINIEFSTSGFRFGHSFIMKLIPTILGLVDGNIRFKDTFLWPFDLYRQNYLKNIIHAMTLGPSEEFDRFVVEDVTNFALKYKVNKTGLDLVSFDIFRERDHGMPTYVQVVKYCLGKDIKSFDDLIPLLGRRNVEYYKKVYNDVRDIELLSAGYAEIHVEGGNVGPTLACILGIQLQQLKYGDRFYFEHRDQTGSFTPDQLQELKKTRLSRIICDNTGIDSLQEYVMFLPGLTNANTLCNMLPAVNLSVFAA